jgi:hypothetical protein
MTRNEFNDKLIEIKTEDKKRPIDAFGRIKIKDK